MARNSGGRWSRFLDMIGLVDDSQQDSYADDTSAETYSRPSTYIPPRQRTAPAEQTRSTARRQIPSQAGRSNYPGSRSYGGASSRSDSRQDARAASSRPRSRFEPEEPVEQEEAPVRSGRAAQASTKTVMIQVNDLRDSKQVITALVRGCTIVLTIEADDPRTRERIVDTLSGAVYALGATISKATSLTYVLAPRNVTVRSEYEVDDRF